MKVLPPPTPLQPAGANPKLCSAFAPTGDASRSPGGGHFFCVVMTQAKEYPYNWRPSAKLFNYPKMTDVTSWGWQVGNRTAKTQMPIWKTLKGAEASVKGGMVTGPA